MIEALLRHKSTQIEETASGAFKALHLATRNRDVPTVALLMENAACLTSKTFLGQTALQMAEKDASSLGDNGVYILLKNFFDIKA